MCHFEPVRDPDLTEGASPTHFTKVCGGDGDRPFCQLCPASPNYWRNTQPAQVADPATPDGGDTPTEAVSPADVWAGTISSKTDGWYAVGAHQAAPCVLCLKGTTMRSPADKPCHKTCAERWRAGERSFAQPR